MTGIDALAHDREGWWRCEGIYTVRPSPVPMARIGHLLLIPDSHRKAKGNAGTAVPKDACLQMLSAASRASLLEMRKAVATAARYPLGPDLLPGSTAKVDLLPAYLRYQGNMYRRIPPPSWEGRNKGVEILILSALYGPIHSQEPVRPYPFSMGESLPGLGTLHRWWRDHGLAAILAEVITAMKPKKVTDLLSGVYRSAVEGYLPLVTGTKVEQVDFPGMGRASQAARGEIVAKILSGGP